MAACTHQERFRYALYIEGAELWSAAHVIAQVSEWFEDYNETASHSALGMKSLREYRTEQALTASL